MLTSLKRAEEVAAAQTAAPELEATQFQCRAITNSWQRIVTSMATTPADVPDESRYR